MISSVQFGQANIELKEDTLTSTVFDYLLMLPNDLFWNIIKKSCFQNNLPETINSIESYEYWPHWNPENTKKINFIEPDLFIRFDNFDLIIEAKRRDDNQQYVEQWENEFIGYINEYKQDKKEVYLLAIGGINNEYEEYLNVKNYGKITVVKCKWYNILETLDTIFKKLNDFDIFNIQNIHRNIYMIITGLEMHGFMKINWLEDIVNTYEINYEDCNEAINDWRTD